MNSTEEDDRKNPHPSPPPEYGSARLSAGRERGNDRERGNEDEGEDEDARHQRFGQRSREAGKRKMERTAAARTAAGPGEDITAMPKGRITQVFSRYCRVRDEAGVDRLCVVRKTLMKLAGSRPVIGDWVRFLQEPGRSEAVVERVMPRTTILTRQQGNEEQPIVANAERMLIVASILEPRVKWGVVDRMIVAAKRGGLEPIVCLNKIDLDEAQSAEMDHYAAMGILALRASVRTGSGLAELKAQLKDRITVLAGHSGVGKSSLIGAVQPGLELKIGRVSIATDKGRHTTSSACGYDLEFGGWIIDTPGVKLFGLAGIKRGELIEYFPDMQAGNAPLWRQESYQRICESLPVE
jgi:ribosome biogenesis GTPase